MTEQVARRASELRKDKNFNEAIKFVEANLHLCSEFTRLPALLQAFYAADASGNDEYAKKLVIIYLTGQN